MKRHKWSRALAFVGAVVVLQACSDDAQRTDVLRPTDDAGTLAVSLSAPAPDVGAVSFTLTGGEVSKLRAAGDGVEIFTTSAGAGWRVAVVGEGLSGALVRFDVADRAAARASLVVELDEVANDRNEVVGDLAGYTVRVVGVN